MDIKKKFQIKIYQGDEEIDQLIGEYYTRHEIEELARRHIQLGHGDSMGAAEELCT